MIGNVQLCDTYTADKSFEKHGKMIERNTMATEYSWNNTLINNIQKSDYSG